MAYGDLMKNLPDKAVTAVMDFSENYTTVFQKEAQGAHWAKNQITLHPIVAQYREDEKTIMHSVVMVSDARIHNNDMVHTFVDTMANYLSKDRNLDITQMYQFTDGCAAQYKSKGPFLDISFESESHGLRWQRNFLGLGTERGRATERAPLLNLESRERYWGGKATVRNAKEMFEYCQTNLVRDDAESCFRRHFFFIPAEKIERDRRVAEKPIKGTSPGHSP
jgi:hypothetical protein